jgi:uncharacterized protein YaaN involved in tellurite resistance
MDSDLSTQVNDLSLCTNALTNLTSDLSSNLNNVTSRVDSLESRIHRIEEKLDQILAHLERQDPIQQRLDRHITFIEKVYTRFKGVLSYLSWRSSPAELELEHKPEEVHRLHDLV